MTQAVFLKKMTFYYLLNTIPIYIAFYIAVISVSGEKDIFKIQ